jgi:hypothetical protein
MILPANPSTSESLSTLDSCAPECAVTRPALTGGADRGRAGVGGAAGRDEGPARGNGGPAGGGAGDGGCPGLALTQCTLAPGNSSVVAAISLAITSDLFASPRN